MIERVNLKLVQQESSCSTAQAIRGLDSITRSKVSKAYIIGTSVQVSCFVHDGDSVLLLLELHGGAALLLLLVLLHQGLLGLGKGGCVPTVLHAELSFALRG